MLKLKENVEQFLNFWAESKTVDRAGHMYQAYASAVVELAALKAKTCDYLAPAKSGKAFVVGFDPDRLEEVAALFEGIERQKETIESIAYDIDAYMIITGLPAIGSLSAQVAHNRNRLQMAEDDLRYVVRGLTAAHPELLPQQIVSLPEAVAAATYHEKTKEEAEEQIAGLKTKIDAATKIFAKYIK